jgi:hypothetical protein
MNRRRFARGDLRSGHQLLTESTRTSDVDMCVHRKGCALIDSARLQAEAGGSNGPRAGVFAGHELSLICDATTLASDVNSNVAAECPTPS